MKLVEKNGEALEKEFEGFKDKCDILHKMNFPTLFDVNWDQYSNESLMKILIKNKYDHKCFREEDCAV